MHRSCSSTSERGNICLFHFGFAHLEVKRSSKILISSVVNAPLCLTLRQLCIILFIKAVMRSSFESLNLVNREWYILVSISLFCSNNISFFCYYLFCNIARLHSFWLILPFYFVWNPIWAFELKLIQLDNWNSSCA